MSPYLFVLAMNVLSKILDAGLQHGLFAYRPKCHRIKLTHLCFADDLLIFSKGNLDSVVGVQCIVQLLYSLSGLQLNCAKSELYSSGISREDLHDIQQVSGFKLGSLPVRYLGVPLVTRMLSEKDYAPLFETISVRINCWAAKHLSYAGRIQLIQSFLFNIQNYWSRQFILPKSVLNKIKSNVL